MWQNIYFIPISPSKPTLSPIYTSDSNLNNYHHQNISKNFSQKITEIKNSLKETRDFLENYELKNFTKSPRTLTCDSDFIFNPTTTPNVTRKQTTESDSQIFKNTLAYISTTDKVEIKSNEKKNSDDYLHNQYKNIQNDVIESTMERIEGSISKKIDYKNGAKYEGEVRENTDIREGKGIYYYESGAKYEGNWINNFMEGLGILRSKKGDILYEGNWKEDHFNGFGILYNESSTLVDKIDWKDFSNIGENWIKYEGEFKHDWKNGKGKIYFSNGETFNGNFKKDKIWGEGKFMDFEGRKIEGVWKNDKFIKQ